MKVLLTGITGNLGYEIAHSLNKRGVEVLPVVRNVSSLNRLGLVAKNAIEADLTGGRVKINHSMVDCIIHCAGNVHFEKSGDSNSRMMRSVVGVAKDLSVPMYYVSTAFLWRESGSKEEPRNAYESDKLNSERILCSSGIPHTIFRPSVLVGEGESGKLVNWTGYYILVSAFLKAAKNSDNSKIRFPLLTGTSNMVPVDQVAEAISEIVSNRELHELIYVTNPEPPKAQWVLNTTLKFFGVRNKFEFVDTDFADYEKLERTKWEEILYFAGKHFGPYWSLPYNFPASAIRENLITEEYLKKTLRSFQNSNNTTPV
ncbi:MAG: SDR family oxidoreductase [bacterium]|nr:SDR family oxidoreductase [bacterium]